MMSLDGPERNSVISYIWCPQHCPVVLFEDAPPAFAHLSAAWKGAGLFQTSQPTLPGSFFSFESFAQMELGNEQWLYVLASHTLHVTVPSKLRNFFRALAREKPTESAGQFGDVWQFAVAWLFTTYDLLKFYMVP